jgi:prevent-host-death family protein
MYIFAYTVSEASLVSQSEAVEVSFRDFRSHLSEYLAMAGRGTTVVVTSRGKPVARVVPPEKSKRMPFDALAGRYTVPDDLETPEDIIEIMENGPL